jgi:DNA polymerase elongation subunit (family B)
LTTIAHCHSGIEEKNLVEGFFDAFTACAQGAYGKMAGFNIHGFDLPFIVRRALALGVPVPVGLIPNGATRFYWPSMFIDLRAIWGMGELNPAGSLDVVARYLGLPGKNGKGAEFARLYRGTAEERGQALEYLTNDLKVTASIGARFGLK